jgi:hypothetical protein
MSVSLWVEAFTVDETTETAAEATRSGDLRVVPWSPAIPMKMVPTEAGGDSELPDEGEPRELVEGVVRASQQARRTRCGTHRSERCRPDSRSADSYRRRR